MFKRLYNNQIVIYLIWFLAIILIFYIGFKFFPHSQNAGDVFFENFSNWDGNHYIEIAKNGYQQYFQYAFFPFYPILIKFIRIFLGDYLLSALLISWVSIFIGLQFFYRLLVLEFGQKNAYQTIVWLLIFPTSFFFLVAYSESLFFMLTILSFYWYKKDNLWLATLSATLASFTRLAGLAVVIALIIDLFIKKKLRKNWMIFLSPSGFLLFCIYQYFQSGNPAAFIEAESYWQRSLTFPGIGFWETIKSLISINGFLFKYPVTLIDLSISVLGVGLILRSIKFLQTRYFVYGLGSIILPLLTPTLSSMPRFFLTIFPIFIILTMMPNYFKLTFMVISLVLLVILATLFINGYWAA